jgi:hypothetical protein
MRKLMLATAAVVVAALGVAGVANAIQGTQAISVKISQSKAGTKVKPKSVGQLSVLTTTTLVAGEPPFATSKAVIYFDKNLVFGGKKFKACATTDAGTIDTKCASAKVGSGAATGSALGQNEALTVKAYNGPAGNKIYLHVVGATPLQIDSVINATLSNATGQFGKKLTVPIPPTLQQPLTGVFATLTSFSTKVGGTSKGTPFVGLKGCTGGKLHFKGVFTYTDGTSKTATNTANCKK